MKRELEIIIDAILAGGLCGGISLVVSGIGHLATSNGVKKIVENNSDGIIKGALNHEKKCVRMTKILEFENQELRNLLYNGKH